MDITTLDHPFQVGAEVLVCNHPRGRRVLQRTLIVEKAHKNGIVILRTQTGYVISSNFRPSRFEYNGKVSWTLREIGRRFGNESYYLSDPELVADLEADEAHIELDRRKREVNSYIQGRLASREVNLSADQLARLVAIINE